MFVDSRVNSKDLWDGVDRENSDVDHLYSDVDIDVVGVVDTNDGESSLYM